MKDITGLREVPKDIQEARKEVLNRIKQEAKGKWIGCGSLL